MTVWTEAIVAIACSYAVALGMWPVLAYLPEPWVRRASYVVLVLVPYSGLVVGPNGGSREAQCPRLMIAIFGGAMATLCFLYWQIARRRKFSEYARFLVVGIVNPEPIIPVKAVSPQSRPQLLLEVLRMAAAILLIAVTWIATRAALDAGVAKYGWLVNYLIVVAAFMVIAQAFGQIVWALGRMTGYRGKPLIDNIWLSRTPAEFWRRWNWPANWLFYRYVYLPCGGRNRVIWATFMVFLLSGLGHELLVAAGLGRMIGHQTAFFLLSGLGVIASPQLERLARWGVAGEVVMRLTTVVFMLATGTLMFATFNNFVPLYQEPVWLAW